MGCDGRARGIFPLRNGSSGKGVRATSREGMFHKVQKKVKYCNMLVAAVA